jgi:hypothetical protein
MQAKRYACETASGIGFGVVASMLFFAHPILAQRTLQRDPDEGRGGQPGLYPAAIVGHRQLLWKLLLPADWAAGGKRA